MNKFVSVVLYTLLLTLPAVAHAGEFKLSSSDIALGKQLKLDQVFSGFGCKGKNISPALSWYGAPKGTKSFVVMAYDPDAPTGSGWWHWQVANIPANVTSLAAGIGKGKELPSGAVQIRNDYGQYGFDGACPPKGRVHRYIFTVYAIKVEKLPVTAKSSAALTGFMARVNSLASASITAVYNH